jgi:hypothetical protein
MQSGARFFPPRRRGADHVLPLFFFIVVVETVERSERATTGLILSH